MAIDKTLDIKEVARRLQMSVHSLGQKAKRGEIPGSKPGKKWVFIWEDVVEHLRGGYTPNAHSLEERKCRYRKQIKALTTTRGSQSKESEYRKALEQLLNQKPSDTKRKERRKSETK